MDEQQKLVRIKINIKKCGAGENGETGYCNIIKISGDRLAFEECPGDIMLGIFPLMVYAKDIEKVLFWLRDNYKCKIEYRYGPYGTTEPYKPLELCQTIDKNLDIIEFDTPIEWYLGWSKFE